MKNPALEEKAGKIKLSYSKWMYLIKTFPILFRTEDHRCLQ